MPGPGRPAAAQEGGCTIPMALPTPPTNTIYACSIYSFSSKKICQWWQCITSCCKGYSSNGPTYMDAYITPLLSLVMTPQADRLLTVRGNGLLLYLSISRGHSPIFRKLIQWSLVQSDTLQRLYQLQTEGLHSPLRTNGHGEWTVTGGELLPGRSATKDETASESEFLLRHR
jgi:hypothetical protein